MISENIENRNMEKKRTNKEKILDYLLDVRKKVSREELVEKTGISSSNFSKLLKKLEDEGKIIREYEQVGPSKFLYISLRTNSTTNSISQSTISQDKSTNSIQESTISEEKSTNSIQNETISEEKSTNSIQNETISHKNPKDNKLKDKRSLTLREKEVINYINGMFNEVQSYGRIIPIDKKQSIVNELFDNLLNLTKGIKYYLNAWESRYQRYLEEKPENPLIDDYKDMQKTLDFLSKLKKVKEMIKHTKNH